MMFMVIVMFSLVLAWIIFRFSELFVVFPLFCSYFIVATSVVSICFRCDLQKFACVGKINIIRNSNGLLISQTDVSFLKNY